MPSSGISKLLEVCYAEATRALLQGTGGEQPFLTSCSALTPSSLRAQGRAAVTLRSTLALKLLTPYSETARPPLLPAVPTPGLTGRYSRLTHGLLRAALKGRFSTGGTARCRLPGYSHFTPRLLPPPANHPHSHPASLRIACPSPRPSPLYRYRVYMGAGQGAGLFICSGRGPPSPSPTP